MGCGEEEGYAEEGVEECDRGLEVLARRVDRGGRLTSDKARRIGCGIGSEREVREEIRAAGRERRVERLRTRRRRERRKRRVRRGALYVGSGIVMQTVVLARKKASEML